jgi:hypothetical protein
LGVSNYSKAFCPACKEVVEADTPEHFLGDTRIMCFRETCGQISRLSPNGKLTIIWKTKLKNETDN